MPLPKNFQELMLPILKILLNEEMSYQNVLELLSVQLNLSDEERAKKVGKGNYTVIHSKAGWAATYLVQAGLLNRPFRGGLCITQRGKDVLKEDISHIDIAYLKKFPEFLDFLGRSKKQTNKDNQIEDEDEDEESSYETPDQVIGDAYEDIHHATREELLDNINKSSPLFFEKLILDLFQAMGYGSRGQSTHVGKSGDGGIDGIINEDALGLEKIYLQAKRYSSGNKINIDQIRSFAGSLDERKARKGIFVTTSSFVDGAYIYAENSPKSLILIDGDELTRLMYEYDVGVRTVQTIKLKKPDLDYFEEL